MSDQPDVEPLPDNTQHLQETDFHVPVGFEPPLPTRKRPQSHDLDLGDCQQGSGRSPTT